MKILFPLVALLAAAPVHAAGFGAMVPNQYVIQEHYNLNPEIWEYQRPLRTVLHYSDPKPCEGKAKCVEVDAILEGPGGLRFNTDGMRDGKLAFEPNFVFYTDTLQVQCDTKPTPFYISYSHTVTTYHQDRYGRKYVANHEFEDGYTVSTHGLQKELCKSLIPKGRRDAADFLDGLACALDPKRCKR